MDSVTVSARTYSRRHWMLTVRAGRYGRGPLLTALIVPSGAALARYQSVVEDWLRRVADLYGPLAADVSLVDWCRETGVALDLEREV